MMLREENCKVWLGHGGEKAQSCSYDTDFVVQAVLAATNVGVMYCLSMEIPIGGIVAGFVSMILAMYLTIRVGEDLNALIAEFDHSCH